jgi:hypothetical protein
MLPLIGGINYGLLVDIIAVAIYITIILVAPELIAVNRLNSNILSILLFPVMFVHSNGCWSSFSPAIVYALWFVNRDPASGYAELMSSLRLEHIIVPFIGSILAGLFCNMMFADSVNTWKRREKRF